LPHHNIKNDPIDIGHFLIIPFYLHIYIYINKRAIFNYFFQKVKY
jgi:hypothetical protein